MFVRFYIKILDDSFKTQIALANNENLLYPGLQKTWVSCTKILVYCQSKQKCEEIDCYKKKSVGDSVFLKGLLPAFEFCNDKKGAIRKISKETHRYWFYIEISDDAIKAQIATVNGSQFHQQQTEITWLRCPHKNVEKCPQGTSANPPSNPPAQEAGAKTKW